jgi:hypothetical protein
MKQLLTEFLLGLSAIATASGLADLGHLITYR